MRRIGGKAQDRTQISKENRINVQDRNEITIKGKPNKGKSLR
jgi:hypothetical protein